MKLALGGLLLGLALATTGWAGEVVLENRSPQPLLYQARYSGQEAWSDTLTLAPWKHHSYSIRTRLIVRSSSGDEWITAVLLPGKRFQYQVDEGGRGEIVESRAEEPGRPNPRRLTVLAVADETYRKLYPDWQDRIAEIVATASNYFDDAFAIRLRLVGCRPWDYEATALENPEHPLDNLLGVDSPKAELVIGWIAMAQAASGRPGWYGHSWCWPFGRHILIADTERRLLYGAAQQLVQSLAVTFGAFAVLDRQSIMQKLLENVPYPWEFGDTARQVILLGREFDFRRGVTSLSPENTRQIRELYRKHHHPDDSPSDDPISRAYRPPRRPQGPRTAGWIGLPGLACRDS
jgi:hypothetical protein